MPDSAPILGYCTNVHPGTTLDEIKRNLEEHALEVKRQVSPDRPMGIGLWLPASTVGELIGGSGTPEAQAKDLLRFREWLHERGLYVFTLNGFPAHDFHEPVVKHQVYTPDWSDVDRVKYTMGLAAVLLHLLPPDVDGSISTLPLGWSGKVGSGWAENLVEVVRFLHDMEQRSGRLIHLDIEPEPGCEIGDTQSLFALLAVLDRHSGIDPAILRRHLRPCLDVCHGAVMFEEPGSMLQVSRDSGFRIGKVQISSALRARFDGRSDDEQQAIRAELARFAEDRYLHQTTIGTRAGHGIQEFHDDLPDALAAHPRGGGEWRVHFHVPVYLDRIGALETTQSHIVELLKAIRPEDGIRHFEVETYAWSVLPPELQSERLADGIARELRWVREVMEQVGMERPR